MKFSRVFLNRLQNEAITSDTVVVIDVLRSFTSAAVALARGASAIYPMPGIAAAIALADRIDHSITVGAIAGGDPAPGFAFGNSPSRLMRANLAGKKIVMSTAAGVRGLQRFRQARHLYAASQAVPEERVLALHVRSFLAGFAATVAEARTFEAVHR